MVTAIEVPAGQPRTGGRGSVLLGSGPRDAQSLELRRPPAWRRYRAAGPGGAAAALGGLGGAEQGYRPRASLQVWPLRPGAQGAGAADGAHPGRTRMDFPRRWLFRMLLLFAAGSGILLTLYCSVRQRQRFLEPQAQAR